MSGWELTQNGFDLLLAWLDPDRQRAGVLYEDIRVRLVRFFDWRRCPFPEECADQVINRVARKIEEGAHISVSPASFFFGVAQFVLKERWKQPKPVETDFGQIPAVSNDEQVESRSACLSECVESLPVANRSLIEQFYQGDGSARIANRKRLAEDLSIPMNALRIRAHRVRMKLEECVGDCVRRESK